LAHLAHETSRPPPTLASRALFPLPAPSRRQEPFPPSLFFLSPSLCSHPPARSSKDQAATPEPGHPRSAIRAHPTEAQARRRVQLPRPAEQHRAPAEPSAPRTRRPTRTRHQPAKTQPLPRTSSRRAANRSPCVRPSRPPMPRPKAPARPTLTVDATTLRCHEAEPSTPSAPRPFPFVNGVQCHRFSLPLLMRMPLMVTMKTGHLSPSPADPSLPSLSSIKRGSRAPLFSPHSRALFLPELPLSFSHFLLAHAVVRVRPRHRSPPRHLWRLTGARCSSPETCPNPVQPFAKTRARAVHRRPFTQG
jgi:hypothetical protein